MAAIKSEKVIERWIDAERGSLEIKALTQTTSKAFGVSGAQRKIHILAEGKKTKYQKVKDDHHYSGFLRKLC